MIFNNPKECNMKYPSFFGSTSGSYAGKKCLVTTKEMNADIPAGYVQIVVQIHVE